MRFRILAAIVLIVTGPGVALSAGLSSIVPVTTGSYAPDAAGCDAPLSAFIYVEADGLGANKTAGKVRKVSREGAAYVLDVLWVEAGSSEADGDRDTVRIEVKDRQHFYFSNTTSEKTLMRWCN